MNITLRKANAIQASITDAIRDLKNAFDGNLIPDSLTDDRYFNVKRMQKIKLV